RTGARELPLPVLVRDDDEIPRLDVVRGYGEPGRVHAGLDFLLGDRIGLVLAHALHRLDGLKDLHLVPRRPSWRGDNKRYGHALRRTTVASLSERLDNRVSRGQTQAYGRRRTIGQPIGGG